MNHSFIDILFMRPSIIIINYNTRGCSTRCEPNSRLGGIYSNFDTLWVYADRSDPKIDSLICNACVLCVVTTSGFIQKKDDEENPEIFKAVEQHFIPEYQLPFLQFKPF